MGRIAQTFLHLRALEAAGIGNPCHRGSKQPHRSPHRRGTPHLCDAVASPWSQAHSREPSANRDRPHPYGCSCGRQGGFEVEVKESREGKVPRQQRSRGDKRARPAGRAVAVAFAWREGGRRRRGEARCGGGGRRAEAEDATRREARILRFR